MDLTHHLSVPASLDDTWAVFAQPERLAPCFPGVTITRTDGDDFTGSIRVKLGPLSLVYEGTGRYIKRDLHSRRLEIEFHGDDKRGHGAAEATVRAGFTANGNTTEVDVQTDLTVTGKPEQFGPAVLSDANDKLLDQFASCIAGRFADGSIHQPEPDIADFTAESDQPTVKLSAAADDEVAAAGPKLGPEEPSVSESVPSVAAVTPASRAASSRPASTPADRPQVWVPANNQAETDLEVLSRVLPPLLKRYWPFLGGAGLAAFVASKIISRRKRR